MADERDAAGPAALLDTLTRPELQAAAADYDENIRVSRHSISVPRRVYPVLNF
jgi:hypothetical protein